MTNSDMPSSNPVQLAPDIWQIDLFEQGLPYRTGAYLLMDSKPTLIETGSANSHQVLLDGLHAIGLQATDLSYVIVTHVHLDHAGGAGQMMQAAKHAKLLVHPRGYRHMVNPSKLWQGAQAVYGDQTEAKFGPVLPVDESQVISMAHDSTLQIGQRVLRFLDSPGHAKHHFTILDEFDSALFAGDAVGILYQTAFTGASGDFIMPSSSPIDFDPAAVRRTLDMLRDIPFSWVYHTHFGRSPKAQAIADTQQLAEAFAKLIDDVYRPGIETQTVVAKLRQLIQQHLQTLQITLPCVDVLDIDVMLDAMGLIYYQGQPLKG